MSFLAFNKKLQHVIKLKQNKKQSQKTKQPIIRTTIIWLDIEMIR